MQILIIGTALPKNTLKTKKQALMGLGLNDLTQDYALEVEKIMLQFKMFEKQPNLYN